jgi:hypothetical protein
MRSSILILIGSIVLLGWSASAQDNGNPAETAARLRTQLSELQDREADAKIRLQEVEYELKPENIERHFAGVGSTRPEELREARRKQLQIEKDRLVAQLNEIAQSRTQLESAISIADARAYQQSALGATSLKPRSRLAPFMTATVVRMGAIVFALIVVGLVLVVSHKRRQSIRSERP